MSLPSPIPYKYNFRTLHTEHDSFHQQLVLEALEYNLSINEVPHSIAQVIRFITREFSSLFSEKITLTVVQWNNRDVYLINSSSSGLDFIGGQIFIGRIATVKIDAGLAIFARKNYSQALWIYTQKQVSIFGIAR